MRAGDAADQIATVIPAVVLTAELRTPQRFPLREDFASLFSGLPNCIEEIFG